jgi:hypothetical protein
VADKALLKKKILQAVGQCAILFIPEAGIKVFPSFFFVFCMNDIVQQLQNHSVWEYFLTYKLEKGQINWQEYLKIEKFIKEKKYLPLAIDITNGNKFSLPQKKIVNKMGSGKKRIVYSFDFEEMMILKLIAFLLYKYDDRQPQNCYSFKSNSGAQHAIRNLNKCLSGKKYWGYKLDIHNYFNSISIPVLLPILKNFLSDDIPLYHFFEQLLSDDRAYYAGTIIKENRGIMAGTPTAPFLANIFLAEIDNYFAKENVVYARYSDDIILFAPTEEKLLQYRKRLLEFIEKYQLTVNSEKEKIFTPDDAFEFLGFKCFVNKIDISEATKRKLKGKISRKSHSLRRWMVRKNATADRAMQMLIDRFNRKFFETNDTDDLTWSRWFFPIVNQSAGFKEIDNYLQQNIRYISTGKYCKSNYKMRYQKLKQLGYRSLVNEYYRYKKSYNVGNLYWKCRIRE